MKLHQRLALVFQELCSSQCSNCMHKHVRFLMCYTCVSMPACFYVEGKERKQLHVLCMHACMQAYMCVRKCACVYVHLRGCVRACMLSCVQACVCVCTRAYACACMCLGGRGGWACVGSRVCVHVHAHGCYCLHGTPIACIALSALTK